jgi:hypothetical protein
MSQLVRQSFTARRWLKFLPLMQAMADKLRRAG